MLREKLLLTLFITLLALDVLVFGVTTSGAWFSDSASSGITIITAGSLDLQVTKDEDPPAGITPGSDYSPIGSFCNHNKGTTDLKYRGLFESDSAAGQDLLPFVTMKVEVKNSSEWAEKDVISGTPADDSDALFHYFQFPDQNPNFEYRYIVEGVLSPGKDVCYRLSAKIEGSVPEEFRQSQLDFQLHLHATQAVNPGW